MTKHLFNYCAIDWYEKELQTSGKSLAEYVRLLGVDGIEQFIYTLEDPKPCYKELTIGAHLNYWPYWMDFWLRKAKFLRQQFRNIRERQTYFKDAMSCDEWLFVIRRNICAALSQQPEYLVWHVAEADNEKIFTYDFRYNDREVLTAAADVFNAVADEVPVDVTVLFENLWWPGLRLTDVRKVKYFFERIERKNVGIMLDTGHLMNNNPRLRTEAEAADYICRVIDKLGSYAELIKGVHLNCSLSGRYLQTFERKVPDIENTELVWRHIVSIDRHQPFSTKAAKQILQCVQPEYVNHEMTYENMTQMQERVAQQLEMIK